MFKNSKGPLRPHILGITLIGRKFLWLRRYCLMFRRSSTTYDRFPTWSTHDPQLYLIYSSVVAFIQTDCSGSVLVKFKIVSLELHIIYDIFHTIGLK